MTIRHFKIFIAVCECNSVTLAGEKLFLAQPAISQAVREMEKYYGVKLFDRIARKLYITENGKKLLSYATLIISLYNEIEIGIKDRDLLGIMRIGASTTIGTCLLPLYVKKFKELFPKPDIYVAIDNSEEIEKQILKSGLDIGLIEGMAHSDSVISETFLEDSLVLICGIAHPFAEKTETTLDELKKQKFLLREKGSGIRDLFDSTMLIKGVSIIPMWESISTSAIINAVINNIGVSVLPYRLVQAEVENKKIAVIPIEGIEFGRKFNIIYHKHKFFSQSVRSFIDICKKFDYME